MAGAAVLHGRSISHRAARPRRKLRKDPGMSWDDYMNNAQLGIGGSKGKNQGAQVYMLKCQELGVVPSTQVGAGRARQPCHTRTHTHTLTRMQTHACAHSHTRAHRWCSSCASPSATSRTASWGGAARRRCATRWPSTRPSRT